MLKMKKVILIFVLIMAFCEASMAQTKVYAEIVGNEYSGLSVSVEFGKNSKRFAYMLKDGNGKTMHFGTMVDAMNQLAKFGWELETSYVNVDGDLDRIASEYHWIISREDGKKEKIEEIESDDK